MPSSQGSEITKRQKDLLKSLIARQTIKLPPFGNTLRRFLWLLRRAGGRQERRPKVQISGTKSCIFYAISKARQRKIWRRNFDLLPRMHFFSMARIKKCPRPNLLNLKKIPPASWRQFSFSSRKGQKGQKCCWQSERQIDTDTDENGKSWWAGPIMPERKLQFLSWLWHSLFITIAFLQTPDRGVCLVDIMRELRRTTNFV